MVKDSFSTSLKKVCDSGHDLDNNLQILVATSNELRDKLLEVPSRHLNSSPVIFSKMDNGIAFQRGKEGL